MARASWGAAVLRPYKEQEKVARQARRYKEHRLMTSHYKCER